MSSSRYFQSFSARLREFICAPSPDLDLFGKLDLELFALQHEHNAAYRRICEARRVSPQIVEHWSRIPAVPASAFKELELTSLSAKDRTIVFHSSGTTKQRPSRHYHCNESLAIYEASLLAWFEACVFVDRRQADFVCLTPPASVAPHSSLIYMFDRIIRRFGSSQSLFLGNVTPDGTWELDSGAVFENLETTVARNHPVMLLGTAFLFVNLLDKMSERGLRFRLPPGSSVLETGGYKGRSRALPKSELHSLITDRLGIYQTDIVCEYGMSELSSQAYGGESGVFQFPRWARVQIISPETGREVQDGETGIIRVFDLANVYSVMAIQTEDLGIRRGDDFELIGRAAVSEPRGCSLMSA